MGKIKKILFSGARLYWTIFRPKVSGSRTLLVRDNQVLLVRHSYQNEWFFPGGGVKWGESYEETAYREIREETGGQGKNLEFIGVYNDYTLGKSDSIALFLCKDFTYTEKTCWEIEEIRLFPMDDLPENMNSGCRRRIGEFLNQTLTGKGFW